VSKFLQNLPVQFFKVLANPKFKRNLKSIFFFLSWPGYSFQPDWPALSSPPLPLGRHPLLARSLLPSLWAATLSRPVSPPLPLGRLPRSPAGPQPTGRCSQPPPLTDTRAPPRSSFSPAPLTAGASPPYHSPPPPRPIPPETTASTIIMAHYHRCSFPSDHIKG
jgi:hypothetical protein